MEERKGEKDEEGEGKAEKGTLSTTWYANVQPDEHYYMFPTLKEVLDKEEPTRTVLYLLPLFGQCVCW